MNGTVASFGKQTLTKFNAKPSTALYAKQKTTLSQTRPRKKSKTTKKPPFDNKRTSKNQPLMKLRKKEKSSYHISTPNTGA